MSEYYSKTRTNYFSVTDQLAFENLMRHTAFTSPACGQITTVKNEEGKVAFLCNGSIDGIYTVSEQDAEYFIDHREDFVMNDDALADLARAKEEGGGRILPSTAAACDYGSDECSYSEFIESLQKLLPSGEACIIMETGSEKFRYLVGRATVLTDKGSKELNLSDLALTEAKQLLNDPEWETQMVY